MVGETAPLPQGDQMSGQGLLALIPPKPWRQGPAGGQWGTAGSSEERKQGEGVGREKSLLTTAPWGLSSPPPLQVSLEENCH